MNKKPINKDQLIGFIQGLIALYEELNGPVAPEKYLTFTAIETETRYFVQYAFVTIDIPSEHSDPDKDNSIFKTENVSLNILKSQDSRSICSTILSLIESIDERKIVTDRYNDQD